MPEEQLLPTLGNSKSTFGSYPYLAREVSSGFGIADMVFYDFKPSVIKQREQSGLNAIDSIDVIRILATLQTVPGEKINIALLENISPTFRKQKQKILDYLVTSHFLLPRPLHKEEYYKGTPYTVGFKDVVAIEAKVDNWQRGLYQAYRYKRFANRSYLAIYAKYVHRAFAHLGEFIRSNVGLVAIDDSWVRVIYAPKREEVKTNIYSALVFENLISKHLFPDRKKLATTLIA